MEGIFFARCVVWDSESWIHWHYKEESYNADHFKFIWGESLDDVRADVDDYMRYECGEVDIMFSKFSLEEIEEMENDDFDFQRYMDTAPRNIDDVDFLIYENIKGIS